MYPFSSIGLLMLSPHQINNLQQQLISDIQRYNLTSNEITEQVYLYLENISGFECLSEENLLKIVEMVKNGLPSTTPVVEI
jgi:hypothetical protein